MSKHSVQGRHLTVLIGLGIMALLLVGRLTYLQVFEQDFLERQGFLRTFRKTPLMAFRGMIADRNGEPLAVSTPVDSVWVDPKQLDWQEPGWKQVFHWLRLDARTTQQKIEQQAGKEFLYLKRQISPEHAKKIEKLQLSGVYLQREYRRYYPTGEASSQLIGFTNIDDQGQDGLELAFEKYLRGKPGYKQIIRDRYGSQVEDLGRTREPQDGHNILLSIDKRLQYLAYRELAQTVVNHDAKAGSLVLLDVTTGEVLAMANYPSYNPNQRNRQVKENLRNRVMTDTYEPGSVMKTFSMVNALSHHYYPDSYSIDTSPGWMTVGTNVVRDVRNYGVLDLTGILRKSSNIGIFQLNAPLDPNTLPTTLALFGFGEPTYSGFPGESAGSLPSHIRWRPFDVATLSFGYTMTATQMQVAEAYAILAANGQKRPVTFLKQSQPVSGIQVVDPKIIKRVNAMLHAVTQDGGGGQRARVPGYEVAGKTGTSRKVTEGGYSANKHRAFFAGFAPYNDPRFVAVVMIDEPQKGGYYGGLIAAPVFSRVMGEALRIFNVPYTPTVQPENPHGAPSSQ